MSATSSVLYFGFGRKRAAYGAPGGRMVASGPEAALGLCLAGKLFPLLVRAGLVPEAVCEECADISGFR